MGLHLHRCVLAVHTACGVATVEGYSGLGLVLLLQTVDRGGLGGRALHLALPLGADAAPVLHLSHRKKVILQSKQLM